MAQAWKNLPLGRGSHFTDLPAAIFSKKIPIWSVQPNGFQLKYIIDWVNQRITMDTQTSKLVLEHQTVWKNNINQLLMCVKQKFFIAFFATYLFILL